MPVDLGKGFGEEPTVMVDWNGKIHDAPARPVLGGLRHRLTGKRSVPGQKGAGAPTPLARPTLEDFGPEGAARGWRHGKRARGPRAAARAEGAYYVCADV